MIAGFGRQDRAPTSARRATRIGESFEERPRDADALPLAHAEVARRAPRPCWLSGSPAVIAMTKSYACAFRAASMISASVASGRP